MGMCKRAIRVERGGNPKGDASQERWEKQKVRERNERKGERTEMNARLLTMG